MRKHLLRSLAITLALSAFAHTAFAQKIRVRKVKGNQAVVDFSGGSLQTGQVYELSSDEIRSGSSESNARTYGVAVSASISSTKSDASGAQSETDMSLAARFGWNHGTYEYGPLMSYSSNGNGSITTTMYKLGAFGDYNMIANVPGEIFLYGIGGLFDIGQLDSGSGVKRDLMDFFVGPFIKWFPTGSPVGFRFDGGYIYQKQSSSSTSTTISGLDVSAGITAYF